MLNKKCLCFFFTKTAQQRYITTTTLKLRKVTPENLNTKSKSVSSQNWLSRQLSDPYVEKAKMMNFRCRSAFKLMEIDDRFKILQPGHIVIDCGAAPGSWTQVVVSRVNSDGKKAELPQGIAVGIDKQQIFPIEGATMFGNLDFICEASQKKLQDFLKDSKANVVLSDMAPSATGVRHLDNENIVSLCYNVLRFAVLISQAGASVLVKLWQCGEAKKLESDIARFYNKVNFVKPLASRADSAEIFLLGREFKGLKSNN